MKSIITASEITVGTQLADTDDFLWEVKEIVNETPEEITVRICSDFSSFQSHWKVKKDGTKGGLIKSFNKTTQLYGIK